MSFLRASLRSGGAFCGSLGRACLRPWAGVVPFLSHTSGAFHLFLQTLYFSTVGAWRGETKLRKQLFPMMRNVGIQSFPIVSLVSFLMGAILVLQSGEPLKEFGKIEEVPGAVGLSLTREISPLMTAIIMTARVGGSFTAVLASMKINEEIMALETMAIRPVGYLVAPRLISMLVMMPCLTVFSYVIGMLGGAVVAKGVYGLAYSLYVEKTVAWLNMADVTSGLVKSVVFGGLISTISCYFGLTTQGGSVGLGRNIMVAVVTSLVLVIIADALATALMNNYVL